MKTEKIEWGVEENVFGFEIHPLTDEDGLEILAEITRDAIGTKKEKQERAQFIVTACNSHAAMKGALEAIAEFQFSGDIGREIAAARECAKAALKLAGEK